MRLPALEPGSGEREMRLCFGAEVSSTSPSDHFRLLFNLIVVENWAVLGGI